MAKEYNYKYRIAIQQYGANGKPQAFRNIMLETDLKLDELHRVLEDLY